MNAADAFVDEMFDDLVTAHPTMVREARVVRAAHAPKCGKIGIVSGRASGHLPLFTGYVGPGGITI
jgi:dihydroxyacetone kinase-like protein